MLFLASDHAGFPLKEALKKYLAEKQIPFEDLGAYALNPDDDYPDIFHPAATRISSEPDARGIFICGSGSGACTVANRHRDIYATNCWNEECAKLARQHGNINVLCLGARLVPEEEALQIVQTFLDTPFKGEERHKRRIEKIDL